jgi:hypothetical protein
MGLETDIKSAKGYIPSTPQSIYETGSGHAPYLWFDDVAVNGAIAPFANAPLGSIYVLKASETAQPIHYEKRANGGRDDDWGALGGIGVFQQRFTFSEFTDGGSTAGTLVLTGTIPAGALIYRSTLFNLTGFTGDTSATIQVGDGSDADRYSTGTPSVFTTAVQLDIGAVSGTSVHATAISTVKVTITSGSDWGLVVAGAATLRIYYFL